VKRACLTAILALLTLSACTSTGTRTAAQRNSLFEECASTVTRFKARDPGMQSFFDGAVGYAVFPSVGKGGLGLGGAHGTGTVLEGNALVGYATLTQVTIGLQAGAQVYDEIIFFQNAEALERFKRSNYEVAAQVGGVVVMIGASSTAQYENGVAIFTLPRGGLMYEASVGGQKFSFRPLTAVTAPQPAAPDAPVETDALPPPPAPAAPLQEGNG